MKKARKRMAGGLAGLFVMAALALSGCETEGGGGLPLAAPPSVQLTAGNGTVAVQFTKLAATQGVDPTYDVYWNTSQTPGSQKQTAEIAGMLVKTVLGAPETEGQPGTLTNHTTYYVWVKAVYEGIGESGFSPVVSTRPVPPPVVPAAPTVCSGEGILELSWTAAADAFTYEVYSSTSGGASPPNNASSKSTTETAIVLSGLSNGTTYYLWLRARNTAGDSGYVTATGTPAAASGAPASAPSGVTLTPGNQKLTVTWNQVSGVPAYKVYYGTANNSASAQKLGEAETVPASAPKTSAVITGLSNGTTYHVWVKSSNSQGDSGFSAPATGTPAAGAPINFSDPNFGLGAAQGEFVYAQNLPASPWWTSGRSNTDRITRVQETGLGNLFTDGAAWHLREKGRQVDFVFLAGGYIDNGLAKGSITVGQLQATVDPDWRRDTLVLLTLTGAQLKAFFDDVAYVVHSGRGGPPNTKFWGNVSSEVHYTLQYPKVPETGVVTSGEGANAEPYLHARIKAGTLKIKIGNSYVDIVDSRTYRIATTDTLASGAFFTTLAAGSNKVYTGTPFWHAAAEYIYDKGVVSSATDGRIVIEGGVPLPAPWTAGNWTDPPANWGADPRP